MSLSRYNENTNASVREAAERREFERRESNSRQFNDFFDGKNRAGVPFSHENLVKNSGRNGQPKPVSGMNGIMKPLTEFARFAGEIPEISNIGIPMISKLDSVHNIGINQKLDHNQNGHSFYHSSVQHFDGQGKKYEKTHTLNQAPGGVKEERKTLHDRDEELKEMSIGQYIHERGVETEKSRRGNGAIQSSRVLHGIGNEEEVERFSSDWKGASAGLLNIGEGNERSERSYRRVKN